MSAADADTAVEVQRPDHYRKRPWKNGRGFTTEICIRPKGTN